MRWQYLRFRFPIVCIVTALLHLQSNYIAQCTQLNLAQSVHEFSSDLYKIVRDGVGQNENIVLSPISVQLALSLALMGAEGQTAQEMMAGLRLNVATKDMIASAFDRWLEPLKNHAMLKIVNKVYTSNVYHIKSTFNEIATSKFHSETESLDFSNSTASAYAINQWVEIKTNNMIKNLISPQVFTQNVKLVLVNAIYFKGFWEHQFPKHDTFKQHFFTNETNSVFVNMMHLQANVSYVDLPELDATAIQLRYKDSDMSMVVILPNQRTGLAALDVKLRTVPLQCIQEQMQSNVKVIIMLPKFKVEFERSLPKTLIKMGMPTMFSGAADFSSLLYEREQIQLSEVIHKAFIDVNEDGAEAAAATGLAIMLRSMGEPDFYVFNANHPFRYFILDGKYLTLFAGSLSTPQNT